MAEIDKLIADVESYANFNNGTRAEFEANGKKFQTPDPEEINLRGYELSKQDPLSRLVGLEGGTLSLLESGPKISKDTGIYVFKGVRVVEKNGSVATEKRTDMPAIEFLATHNAAGAIAQDASVKYIQLIDRSHTEESKGGSKLKIIWEEELLGGRALTKTETLVFAGGSVFKERIVGRADNFKASHLRTPINDASRERAERVLLGIQEWVRAAKS